MEIIHLISTPSTNDYLKQTTHDGECIVWTDNQTEGRGQRGNSWESEAGKNLTFSMLIHPTHIKANEQFCISEAIALGIHRTLSELTENVSIKWPNDIYIGNRKVCGILIENSLEGTTIANCIIGVGINVNQQIFRSNAPNPVSLIHITKKETDIEELLGKIATAFTEMYTLTNTDRDLLHSMYMSCLYHKDGTHRYEDHNGTFEATIAGIEPSGILVLTDREGNKRKYAFKEVRQIVDNFCDI